MASKTDVGIEAFIDDDVSCASSDVESADTFATDDRRDEVQEVREMTKKETFNMEVWWIMVIGIMGFAAVVVTYSVYLFLLFDQESKTKEKFSRYSEDIVEAARDQQRSLKEAFAIFSGTVCARAEANPDEDWPFITLPFFEQQAENLKALTSFEGFMVYNVVDNAKRGAYESWAAENYKVWVEESHILRYGNLDHLNADEALYHQNITAIGEENDLFLVPESEQDRYIAEWTSSPPPFTYSLINWNLASHPDYQGIIDAAFELQNDTLATKAVFNSPLVGTSMTREEHQGLHSQEVSSAENARAQHPHSLFVHPIHKVVGNLTSDIVAFAAAMVAWDNPLIDLLPESVGGIQVVFSNNCGQVYTYEVRGRDAVFLGEGDLHEEIEFDYVDSVSVTLSQFTNPDSVTTNGHCQYKMRIYPTSDFKESYDTAAPELFATGLAFTFLAMAIVVFVYDNFVKRRNTVLEHTAAKSNAIVSQMFPGKFRDEILGSSVHSTGSSSSAKKRFGGAKSHLQSFMSEAGGTTAEVEPLSRPLADLFMDITILFADIAGFTAWSSVREPTQVFLLLESLYGAFDEVAKKRGIYKIETVGDCYVAVAGLPKPRKDHALAMCKFANDILQKTNTLVRELETTLGPETADLQLRVGIHSGPVTGGVLRGERSRFQLFGDSMNTAARMESTGVPGEIQLSQETAALVIEGGKEKWLMPREDAVHAKGLGMLSTYFLKVSYGRRGTSSSSGRTSERDDTLSIDSSTHSIDFLDAEERKNKEREEKTQRLVQWNVDNFIRLIKQIVVRREARLGDEVFLQPPVVDPDSLNLSKVPLEEVKEVIELPEFDSEVARRQQDPQTVQISASVVAQLIDFITCIAGMYRDNAFHNFEHASHVTMSVSKLLSRIVAPNDLGLEDMIDEFAGDDSMDRVEQTLHDYTFGITSDPLTQLACIFSALVHDVDHVGVPNVQLIKENADLAALYKNRSVAEQNSLALAWDLFIMDRFWDLRDAICPTEEELLRFRQLVVNSVMATDICDKMLKDLRNGRWDRAFNEVKEAEEQSAKELRENTNRKATIVIEHLIQASDVAHTMQHWHIYRKWNEKFFEECYVAYVEGRADMDPSQFWYKGEIGFFDFYIIPLAKKLKNCGVFGVSSDEYLNYACRNRNEWEQRGEDIVVEMLAKVKAKLEPSRVESRTNGVP